MIVISIGHIVNRDALYLTDGDLYKTNPAMGNLLMAGASHNRCYTYIHVIQKITQQIIFRQ